MRQFYMPPEGGTYAVTFTLHEKVLKIKLNPSRMMGLHNVNKRLYKGGRQATILRLVTTVTSTCLLGDSMGSEGVTTGPYQLYIWTFASRPFGS